MVHEAGHFFAGKWLGFDIYEFGMGFGPKLATWNRKGVKFSIGAIPFGGFVAFDDEKNLESGELSFDTKPVWKRLIVVLAGPVMNIVIAFLIVVLLFSTFGVYTADTMPDAIVEYVNDGSPALESGLLAGDEFTEINGVDINNDYETLSKALQNEELDVTVLRDGQEVNLTINPDYDESGERYMIGITLQMERERYPFGTSIKMAFQEVGNMIVALLQFFGNLVSTGQGAKDVSGIVGAVAIMSGVAQQQDFAYFLYLVAFISINLGVFNLLPIPPCDGFRVLMYLFEAIRGKKISVDTQMKIQAAGFFILFALAIIITYKDITGLVTGG